MAKNTGRNPVKKNMDKLTKPSTHRDRKKDSQRGYEKHKGKDTQSHQEDIKTSHKTPQKPTHGFIDADMPLFMAASAGEQIWYVYKDEDGDEVARFDSAAKGKHWLGECEVFGVDMEFGYEGDLSALTRHTEYEIKDFKECTKAFESIIKKWAAKAGVKEYTAYVSKGSGAENFRYAIATLHPYKEGRDGLRKPHHLEDLRKWCHSQPWCKKAVGLVEVDDITCAMAQRRGDKAVVIAGDKDAKQVVGTWYIIPDEMDEPVYSDPATVGYVEYNGKKAVGCGWLFLLEQTLEGDKADTYKGCTGIGDTKACDILSPFNHQPIEKLPEIVNIVAKVFEEKMGGEYTYINHHIGEKVIVSYKDVFIEMLKLAYMLKHKNDVCPLIEMIED